jgi:UDP-N-acetylmuramoylalanine-D-glutamate ligase
VPDARARGVIFTSGTALWYGEHEDANDIAVTGTKGKSTTSALIAHLLRASGRAPGLAGNIGLPLLELIGIEPEPDCWVVELSSYQAGDARSPARVAVVPTFFPSTSTGTAAKTRYIADKLALVTEAARAQVGAQCRRSAPGIRALNVVAASRQRDAAGIWRYARVHWHLRGRLGSCYRGEHDS